MAPRCHLTLEPTGSIGDDVVVCHIDEFRSEAIQSIDEITRGESKTAPVDTAVADQVCRCDYVKFTEYYRVGVSASTGSTD